VPPATGTCRSEPVGIAAVRAGGSQVDKFHRLREKSIMWDEKNHCDQSREPPASQGIDAGKGRRVEASWIGESLMSGCKYLLLSTNVPRALMHPESFDPLGLERVPWE
jgi:hypothetical protein